LLLLRDRYFVSPSVICTRSSIIRVMIEIHVLAQNNNSNSNRIAPTDTETSVTAQLLEKKGSVNITNSARQGPQILLVNSFLFIYVNM
jgi:hypothetical protein